MKISCQEYNERISRFFNGPLRSVMENNFLCKRIAEEYAHGNIIHYEEALAQMVIRMDIDWKVEQRKYYELMQTNIFPVLVCPTKQ